MNTPRPATKDIGVARSAVKVNHGIGSSKQSAPAQSLLSQPMNTYRALPPTIAPLAVSKYGKAPIHASKVTTTFVFGSKRRDSATPSCSNDHGGASSKSRARENDDGPRTSKRRRQVGAHNHEDIWQREEDARLLNKVSALACHAAGFMLNVNWICLLNCSGIPYRRRRDICQRRSDRGTPAGTC